MTLTEILTLASGPGAVGAYIGLRQAWRAWRAHRERVELRRLELEEKREQHRYEERRRAQAIEENTGKHELAGFRDQARTMEWLRDRSDQDRERIQKLEDREEECRARVDGMVRELEQCKEDREALRALHDRMTSVEQRVPVDLEAAVKRTARSEAQLQIRRSLSPAGGSPAQPIAVVEIDARKKRDEEP